MKKYLNYFYIIATGLFLSNIYFLSAQAPAADPIPGAPAAAPAVTPPPTQAPVMPTPVTQPTTNPAPTTATAPVPTSAAPTPAPASASAPVAAAPTAQPETQTPPASDKEFEEVYQKLNQVTETKKILKKQLNDTEEKLETARKLAIEAKKACFDVIQKTSAADAEILVAQVDKNLQSLKDTHKTLKEIELPKFENTAKQIDDLTQSIQNKVTELQNKGLKFQISQAQLELQKQQPLAAASPTTPGAPTSQTPQPEGSKTIWQKTYETTVDWAAYGTNLAKKGWTKLKNWVYSPADDGKKNPKSVENQPTIKVTLPSDSEIKAIIAEFDNIIRQLDEIQISMIQKYAEAKKKTKNIEMVVKSNDDIQKYFERLDEQNPAWKASIVNAFSSLVDGVYVIAKAVKKTFIKIYKNYIAGFIRDIKNKSNEMETQPAPAKPEAPKVETPAIPVSIPTPTPTPGA